MTSKKLMPRLATPSPDGWLSAKSAALYDYQVETLFLGSADAMRRTVLPFMAEWLAGRDVASTQLLDAATGTGRFLSFVKDNWPALRATAVDLSPFYLDRARQEALQRWVADGSVACVQGNVESLPQLASGSFDGCTCVYLFHELPGAARAAAVAEFSRLLRPGGRLFFVDSAQRGDGAFNNMPTGNDRALDGFPRFAHEPYYEDYTKSDLVSLFRRQGGFKLLATKVAWVTKVLVFEKMSDEERAASDAAAAQASDDEELSPDAAQFADAMRRAAADWEAAAAVASAAPPAPEDALTV